ncbi:MAG: Hsp20 family protein [Candidatus Latescibacteria bacterium]|nr:Hsp20 family protein [Candidatus Latescibacterota bacterium]
MTVVTKDNAQEQTVETSAAQPQVQADPAQLVKPLADIYQTKDAVVIEADIPGVAEEGLDITLEQDILTVEGLVESGKHGYRRRFSLSDQVDRQSIEAALENGVLRLTLPRAEASLARKIDIKTAD